MKKVSQYLCLMMVLFPGLPAISETESTIPGTLTVKEVMAAVITPATNTLWGAEVPQSDEEWRLLEEAAITTIAAATLINRGGAGVNDNEWASDPAWSAFDSTMINAAFDALKAIRERGIDALFVATDILYPPCEGCHIAFNPDPP